MPAQTVIKPCLLHHAVGHDPCARCDLAQIHDQHRKSAILIVNFCNLLSAPSSIAGWVLEDRVWGVMDPASEDLF
jgi:hypothetical protein